MKLSHDELPDDLREYLAGVPEVTEADRKALGEAIKALDDDPEFQADLLKSLIVEKFLAALEEVGATKSRLASNWNCSRQYVSKLLDEDNPVNFTIETLCKLAHQMDRRVSVELLKRGETVEIRPTYAIEKTMALARISSERESHRADSAKCFRSADKSMIVFEKFRHETVDLAA